MNWLEVALIVFGVCAFVGSFIIKGKSDNESNGQQIDTELIRDIIDSQMKDAKERVTEVVDETIEYAVEKTERASERISNEKIMAISEYSETVLADINKSHQEVMFLYDMLNDKHNNLKETVKKVDKTAKEAEEAVNAAVMEKEYAKRQMERLALPVGQDNNSENVENQPVKYDEELRPLIVKSVKVASSDIINSDNMQPVKENKNVSPVSAVDLQTLGAHPQDITVVDVKPTDIRPVKVYSLVDNAPHIEKNVNSKNQEQDSESQDNNNDRILKLHKEGVSDVEIAKKLGLGVGEVKLVINLFKGAV
jgi:hypothetical protein